MSACQVCDASDGWLQRTEKISCQQLQIKTTEPEAYMRTLFTPLLVLLEPSTADLRIAARHP
jgi:hypothetical protein